VSSASCRLRLHARSTLLEFSGAEAVTLPVGIRDVADNTLRHDPPTPAELERAIDVVEDALSGSRLAQAERGALATSDPVLRSMPGLQEAVTGLSREAVEAQFQRLASRSLGTPVSEAELPASRDFAAALLILRECMHHLGFDSVQLSAE
jgi:exopolyphosphatase/pppGpp-phosphohydrolase